MLINITKLFSTEVSIPNSCVGEPLLSHIAELLVNLPTSAHLVGYEKTAFQLGIISPNMSESVHIL